MGQSIGARPIYQGHTLKRKQKTTLCPPEAINCLEHLALIFSQPEIFRQGYYFFQTVFSPLHSESCYVCIGAFPIISTLIFIDHSPPTLHLQESLLLSLEGNQYFSLKYLI